MKINKEKISRLDVKILTKKECKNEHKVDDWRQINKNEKKIRWKLLFFK